MSKENFGLWEDGWSLLARFSSFSWLGAPQVPLLLVGRLFCGLRGGSLLLDDGESCLA